MASTYAPDGYKYREPAAHPFEDDTEDRVGIILKDYNLRLLVVKGETGKYSLPKGCRHRGETEWEGATRELWEETGIDLEAEENVHYSEKRVLAHGTYFKFRVMKKGSSLKQGGAQDGEEKIKEVLWIKPCQLKRLHFAECNTDLKLYICPNMAKRYRKTEEFRESKELKKHCGRILTKGNRQVWIPR